MLKPQHELTIRALRPDERAAWEPLWQGYLNFYESRVSPETTEVLWQRLHDPRTGEIRGEVLPGSDDLDAVAVDADPRLDHGHPDLRDGRDHLSLGVGSPRRHDRQPGASQVEQVGLVGVPADRRSAVEQRRPEGFGPG